MMNKHVIVSVLVMLVGIVSTIVGCATGEGHRMSQGGLSNPFLVYDDVGQLDIALSLKKVEATAVFIKNVSLGPDATPEEIEEQTERADKKLYYLRLAIEYLDTMKEFEGDTAFVSAKAAVSSLETKDDRDESETVEIITRE